MRHMRGTGVLRGADEAVLEALLEQFAALERLGAARHCDHNVRPPHAPHFEQQAPHLQRHARLLRARPLPAVAHAHVLLTIICT